jgi:TonB family protein
MYVQTFFRRLAVLVLAVLVLVSAIWAQEEMTRKIKSKVDPVYPAIARQLHLSGIVKIQVTIGTDGKIKSTKVIGGHPVLVQAAVDALQKWKFEPANEETTGIIPFRFTQ